MSQPESENRLNRALDNLTRERLLPSHSLYKHQSNMRANYPYRSGQLSIHLLWNQLGIQEMMGEALRKIFFEHDVNEKEKSFKEIGQCQKALEKIIKEVEKHPSDFEELSLKALLYQELWVSSLYLHFQNTWPSDPFLDNFRRACKVWFEPFKKDSRFGLGLQAPIGIKQTWAETPSSLIGPVFGIHEENLKRQQQWFDVCKTEASPENAYKKIALAKIKGEINSFDQVAKDSAPWWIIGSPTEMQAKKWLKAITRIKPCMLQIPFLEKNIADIMLNPTFHFNFFKNVKHWSGHPEASKKALGQHTKRLIQPEEEYLSDLKNDLSHVKLKWFEDFVDLKNEFNVPYYDRNFIYPEGVWEVCARNSPSQIWINKCFHDKHFWEALGGIEESNAEWRKNYNVLSSDLNSKLRVYLKLKAENNPHISQVFSDQEQRFTSKQKIGLSRFEVELLKISTRTKQEERKHSNTRVL